MRKIYQHSSNPQHLYALCEMQKQQKSFQAKQCLSKLLKVAPAEKLNQLEQLLAESNDN